MQGTELLANEPREVSRLLKAVESAQDAAGKRQLSSDPAAKLVGHDGVA